MTDAAKKLLEAASALPEDERLELASELIASVDGPPDADWESAWLAEIDRRVKAARDKAAQVEKDLEAARRSGGSGSDTDLAPGRAEARAGRATVGQQSSRTTNTRSCKMVRR